MGKRSRNYDEWLLGRLKDPKEAVAYLNACLEDDEEGDEFEKPLLMALRNVAKAHGFAAIAERAHLGRESLYKTLSDDGAPKLKTIVAILDAMGLRLKIDAKDEPLLTTNK